MDADLAKRPSEILKENVYLNTVNVLPTVIRSGYDLVGPNHLLFATDHLWVEADSSVENLRSQKLPPADEATILGANAKKLFKL